MERIRAALREEQSADRLAERAAANFFGMVQDMWWNDLLLMLWKLTDKDARMLSIVRLPELAPVSLRAELKPKIANAVTACKFAHKVRHNLIAHRNADIAMKVKPMPKSSRADIQKAIAALDDMFNFVHGSYTNEGPMMWERSACSLAAREGAWSPGARRSDRVTCSTGEATHSWPTPMSPKRSSAGNRSDR